MASWHEAEGMFSPDDGDTNQAFDIVLSIFYAQVYVAHPNAQLTDSHGHPDKERLFDCLWRYLFDRRQDPYRLAPDHHDAALVYDLAYLFRLIGSHNGPFRSAAFRLAAFAIRMELLANGFETEQSEKEWLDAAERVARKASKEKDRLAIDGAITKLIHANWKAPAQVDAALLTKLRSEAFSHIHDEFDSHVWYHDLRASLGLS